MGIGTPEMLIFLILGVLLFGSRLPDVAKSIGRSFYEFKKGLNDMGGNEIKEAFNFDPSAPLPEKKKDDSVKTEAQKFEPPPEESAEQESDAAETSSFQSEKYE